MKKYIALLLITILIIPFQVIAEESNSFLEWIDLPEDILREQFPYMYENTNTNSSWINLLSVEEINSGELINSTKSWNPVFTPDGQYIIYTHADDRDKLYKKNANDNSNWTPITSWYSHYPIISPDGKYVVYKHHGDWQKLYKKNIDDNSDGVAITDIQSHNAVFSPDGKYIIYNNWSDWWKLYKKNIEDDSQPVAITSAMAFNHIFSQDGQYIIYVNYDDGKKLYKTSIGDNLNGEPITVSAGLYPTLSPDGNNIVYTLWKLYKKDYADTSNGSTINTASSYYPKFSLDGNSIFYANNNDWLKLYKKEANDISDGEALTPGKYYQSALSPDGKYIIYNNINDWFKLYKINIQGDIEKSAPTLSSLTSSQSSITKENEASVSFTINGITDPDEWENIIYSYSFNNSDYTLLPEQTNTPVNNTNLSFNVNLSDQIDGSITIYVKANDGSEDSNVIQITLDKKTKPDLPLQPTNFSTTSITTNSIEYTWADNANGDNNETKYSIKDENDNIIQDNIEQNSISYIENSLVANTSYSRKVCASNETGESCSETIVVQTPEEVTATPVADEKITNFSFAGINIDVIESTNIFQIVFSIWWFKINFSIEKI